MVGVNFRGEFQMMVNFFVVRACQVISTFCRDRIHVCLPRSAVIINNISKTFGRSLSVDLRKSSLNVHRGNVFSKAQNQQKDVAACDGISKGDVFVVAKVL